MPPKNLEPEKDDDDDIEIKVEDDKDEGELVDEPEDTDSKKKPVEKEGGDGDGDEPEKEAAADDESEEDREALLERRRKEKQDRKERRERAIARDKLEMEFLRKRNEELEKRMLTQEMRAHRQDHYTVEQKIAEAEREARLAEEVMAKAIAEANGDDAAKALRFRDEALAKIRELSDERDTLKKTEEDVKTQKTVADPVVNSYAKAWISKNPWYDVNGGDEDSRIVLEIDTRLANEGYIPRTELYWKELDKRVRRNLPHRFESDDDLDHDEDEPIARKGALNGTAKGRDAASPSQNGRDRQAKGGPPIGAKSEHAPASTRKEVYISKERKEALIAAGVWDDPVLRTKYVKQYQRWDKENATR